MMKLVSDGFQPLFRMLPRPEPWSPGGLDQFIALGQKPYAYFRALLSRESILEKGVHAIAQDMPDGYYKCLLNLEPGPLMAALENLEGVRANDQFLLALGPEAPVGEEPPPGEPAPPPPPQVLAPLPGRVALPPILPRPVREEWARCLVDTGGGTPCAKCYFDHFTSTSASGAAPTCQRAWVDCHQHPGCFKWFTINTDNYRLFVSRMYFWFMQGFRPELANKFDHRAIALPDEEVAALEPRLRLRPF